MIRFLLLFLALLPPLLHAQSAAPPPNIILVLIDDMGSMDLGCTGGEGKTPHIDRIASEGVRFTQYYTAAPICSPSRCGILTGQRPERWKITSYLESRAANQKRGMVQWLDPKAPSLARMFNQAGYATGHFGKWHLGGQRDVGEAPLITEYGFDASLTQFEGLGDRVLAILGGFDGRPEVKMGLGLGSEKLGRGYITWMPRHQVTSRFVDRTLQFITETRKSGKKPFFVNLWPDDVHGPWSPPPGLAGDGSKRALYLGVLAGMDTQFGVLFDHIRNDPSLMADTLLVLASDNGHEAGAGSAGPLRGSKGLLYEGGVRSPLIVWGGRVPKAKAGTVNTTTIVSALDLLPSFLSLAGVTPPAGVRFDGENLAAALLGDTSLQRQGPLMWRRPPDRRMVDKTTNPDLAIREGQWKLLVDAGGASPQLYDLSKDPNETQNLAGAQPEVVGRLSEAVQKWNATNPK